MSKQRLSPEQRAQILSLPRDGSRLPSRRTVTLEIKRTIEWLLERGFVEREWGHFGATSRLRLTATGIRERQRIRGGH